MAWKELKPSEWMDEIDRGLEYRRDFGLEDGWSDLEALFYDVHPSLERGSPNLVASMGDALLSSLSVPRPYVRVRATGMGTVEKARKVEAIDNKLIGPLKVRQEVMKALLHSFLWGTGILKIGYDSSYGWDPNQPGGDLLGMSFSQFDRKGRRIEFSETVRPGMPWVMACLPHDIVVPWGTTTVDDAPWIAHRVVRHNEDIKADPKYVNVRGLEPVMSRADFAKSYVNGVKTYRLGESWEPRRTQTRDVEFNELWEIHDRRTGKVFVIATGYDKFLRNDEDLLQLDGLPFVDVRMVLAARSFWVTSDAHYLRSFQAELSDIALQSSNQRRSSTLKMLAERGAISKEEVEKILSRDVSAVAWVESGTPLRDAVMPMTPYNNNQQLQMDAEYVRRSAREMMGFGRNQLGELESGRRTAFEVAKASESHDVRMARRQTMAVSDVYREVFKKINAIIFEFWKGPRFVEMGGEQMVFTGKDLKDDYGYDVVLTSDHTKTVDQRKQEGLALYQLLRDDPLVDQVALRRYLAECFVDPAFKEVFKDADLRLQMLQQQMSLQGEGQGGVSP